MCATMPTQFINYIQLVTNSFMYSTEKGCGFWNACHIWNVTVYIANILMLLSLVYKCDCLQRKHSYAFITCLYMWLFTSQNTLILWSLVYTCDCLHCKHSYSFITCLYMWLFTLQTLLFFYHMYVHMLLDQKLFSIRSGTFCLNHFFSFLFLCCFVFVCLFVSKYHHHIQSICQQKCQHNLQLVTNSFMELD
jgi:hypothetical protein